MTREQFNVAYCVCWFAAMALGCAISGPVAALVVFFLPAFLLATWIGVLGKLKIDWDRRPKRSVQQTLEESAKRPGPN
jgi:hypothetical protein